MRSGWRRMGCGRRWMRGSRCVGAVPARSHRARSLSARRTTRKRQQGNVARALDGHAQSALVPRADAGHAARKNLAAFLHELRKNVRALVVDEIDLLDAKLADFLFAEILALAAGTSPGPARTAFAASASRATVPARAAFPPRSSTTSTRRWCLLLFLWHTYHPSEFLVVGP